mmetsp:Transcript_20557/g.29719  ORF Transcript_20557/g.29719 Transcript_20557/m.29719 type:complete len:282 (+) Transcript_20557:40-885(+)|eukprot:CAMPEP_0202467510 /NCGR_PEP_ID=MMETSP1360-20130828/72250_1 /ASSEMBLY_ACC=CAM_ASM_000848 /TAXON_ID=515479 /ORGANISM="Licmophora paradoxa, Strain CCMP2313" /LENGTH=281 /DNA_ID=CAMNT_0049092081 /DNA_START=7 /DNA_END=852 /DNA_ORIENTATION=+
MTTTEDEADSLGCCARCRAEWSLSIFDKYEFNNKEVDFAASFQPKGLVIKISKLTLVCWTIASMAQDLIDKIPDYNIFWLAWLTVWALLLSVMYLVCSFLCTVTGTSEEPSLLVYVTWTLGSIACPGQLIVTILYWTIDHSLSGNKVTYINSMLHGGVLILVWIDALVINRIPVRFRQVSLIMALALIYLLWTGIHSAFSIGNPNHTDRPDQDDDALYEAINWRERPVWTIIICSVILLMTLPIFFLFWAASAYGGGYRFDNGLRRHKSFKTSSIIGAMGT